MKLYNTYRTSILVNELKVPTIEPVNWLLDKSLYNSVLDNKKGFLLY